MHLWANSGRSPRALRSVSAGALRITLNVEVSLPEASGDVHRRLFRGGIKPFRESVQGGGLLLHWPLP